MSNKEIVTRFFEHFSNGEIDQAFAMVSDDAKWWVPGDLPFSSTKSKLEYLQVVGGDSLLQNPGFGLIIPINFL
jgi:ketosteroid isomerase-like protein